jgi:hypothetical protein
MANQARASDSGASNNSLHAAKRAKNDEFYTQLTDIEKELHHYKSHFKGKVVFCNCDDPEWSGFWKYFKLNFKHLGLKKVVATHYAYGSQSYKLEYSGLGDPVETPLMGDGDFRSAECLEILKEADLVVTNPPFSLFREYVAQLMEHDKRFLIIGSNNAITYKETFKFIKDNRLWLGATAPKAFGQPDGSLKKFGNIGWYTNLPHKKRNEELILFRPYAGHEGQYPKYANYDAIEVSKVADIPTDYAGHLGVPITFLDKYNPDQFEIVGSSRTLGTRMSEVAEKGAYSPGGPRFYLNNGDGTYQRLYDRLVIKRRQA